MLGPLQEWATANEPSDAMYYKGGYWNQILFVRDVLVPLVGSGLHETDAIATVISNHMSKSVQLPVYALSRPDLGLIIYLRNNFYDWKMSVVSDTPIRADFTGLFKTTGPVEPAYTGNELASVYFEGFPSSLVFGYYEESDRRRWSAAIGGDHTLWTSVFLLMRFLGVVKPQKYGTKAEHLLELAADNERWKRKQATNA